MSSAAVFVNMHATGNLAAPPFSSRIMPVDGATNVQPVKPTDLLEIAQRPITPPAAIPAGVYQLPNGDLVIIGPVPDYLPEVIKPYPGPVTATTVVVMEGVTFDPALVRPNPLYPGPNQLPTTGGYRPNTEITVVEGGTPTYPDYLQLPPDSPLRPPVRPRPPSGGMWIWNGLAWVYFSYVLGSGLRPIIQGWWQDSPFTPNPILLPPVSSLPGGILPRPAGLAPNPKPQWGESDRPTSSIRPGVPLGPWGYGGLPTGFLPGLPPRPLQAYAPDQKPPGITAAQVAAVAAGGYTRPWGSRPYRPSQFETVETQAGGEGAWNAPQSPPAGTPPTIAKP